MKFNEIIEACHKRGLLRALPQGLLGDSASGSTEGAGGPYWRYNVIQDNMDLVTALHAVMELRSNIWWPFMLLGSEIQTQ
jgi:hypothetical protein